MSIQRALKKDRVRLLPHFRERLSHRGLLWLDVVAVIHAAREARADGTDRFGRERWLIAGQAASAFDIEIVCVIDYDQSGELVVFITLYFV